MGSDATECLRKPEERKNMAKWHTCVNCQETFIMNFEYQDQKNFRCEELLILAMMMQMLHIDPDLIA